MIIAKQQNTKEVIHMNNNIISLNQSKIFIGIDLAKKIHVAKAVDVNGNEVAYLSALENTREGFEEFASWVYKVMKQTKVESCLIGMEPTGIYWQRIATFIKKNMENCEAVFVKQEKVKIIRQFYDNGKGKNDPIDALAIARCVKERNYFNMNIDSQEFMALKALSRLKNDYLKRQSQLINKLDNDVVNVFPGYKNASANWASKSLITIFAKYPLPEDIVAATEEELFTQLRTNVKSGIGYKFIRLLKDVALEFVSNDTGNIFAADNDTLRYIMKKRFNELIQVQKDILEVDEMLEKKLSAISYSDNMVAIKGIGTGTVAALLGETGDLSKYETGKHLISFVGFDLKQCSSGEHKGKIKISKCGSRRLRNIVYKVCLPLINENEYFNQLYNYYIGRKENPLKKKQAQIAVCCKLLRVLHGMVKNNSKFDGNEVIKGILDKKAS